MDEQWMKKKLQGLKNVLTQPGIFKPSKEDDLFPVRADFLLEIIALAEETKKADEQEVYVVQGMSEMVFLVTHDHAAAVETAKKCYSARVTHWKNGKHLFTSEIYERPAKEAEAKRDQAVEIRSFEIKGVSLFVKLIGNTIHLLDGDEGKTLTNAMDKKFQFEVLNRLERWRVDPDVFTWILYHTDGVVTRFHAGNFRPLGEDLPLADPEFMAEMQRMYGGR